jgi:putative nucleotidyltransferase with HDIG domain
LSYLAKGFPATADMAEVLGRKTVLQGGQAAGLTVAVVGAVWLSTAAQWRPPGVIAGLLLFALITEPVPLQYRKVAINGAFMSIVLASVIAGPGPAVLVGLVTMIENALRRRLSRDLVLPNLSTHAVFPFVGALMFQLLGGRELMHDAQIAVIPLVVAVFMAMNLLNFLLIAIDVAIADGHPTIPEAFRSVYFEVFPVEFVSSLLTAIVGFAYVAYGPGALLFLAVVALSFQYLIRMALNAAQRKDEVEERNQQLAALQFGLISTTMKTLALRDHMTARHSAAVARYSREMARELGLPEAEQELFHTAGLFHDIGKFIFPDSILFAGKGLTDEEYAIVRRHPEVGADLIAEIEGYGPVAKIVRHHHERIDGRGYPFGLTSDDIPLGSKIIAVADVYDVLTARDTYRQPVSSADAFAELRHSAGSQLDVGLVEMFIGLITRRGVVFSHSSADDFEAELALERRVKDYARPRLVA